MPITPLAIVTLTLAIQAQAPLRLVLEFSLDAGTGVSFGAITGMDIAPDGSIVTVDNGNGVIYRFTPAGKLRDSLGHKGQGPGEFIASAGVAVGPAGEVALADISTRRLTIWNADGKLRGTFPVTGGMPIELLWRGATPVIGLLNFSPGVGAHVTFGPVTLGEQAGQGNPIAAFPDPSAKDFATAASCGMCRRALTPDGKLIAASRDSASTRGEGCWPSPATPAPPARLWTCFPPTALFWEP